MAPGAFSLASQCLPCPRDVSSPHSRRRDPFKTGNNLHEGGILKKERIHVCLQLDHCAVYLKPTQHYRSARLQKDKKKKTIGQTLSLLSSDLPVASHLPQNKMPGPPEVVKPSPGLLPESPSLSSWPLFHAPGLFVLPQLPRLTPCPRPFHSSSSPRKDGCSPRDLTSFQFFLHVLSTHFIFLTGEGGYLFFNFYFI